MARPIKVITAGAEIRAELQRRANAPTISDRPQARHCPRIRLSGFRGSLMLTRVASDPASLLRPAISTGTPRRNRGIETFGRRSSSAPTAWVCCT